MSQPLPKNFSSPVLQKFRQRVLHRTVEETLCGWEDILILQGLVKCAVECNDSEALRWVEAWLEHHGAVEVEQRPDIYPAINHRRGFVLNDYCGNWGAPLALAPLHQLKPSDKALSLIRATCDTILHRSTRLPGGVIAHGGFARQTVWVDTLYYASSSLAHAFAVTDDSQYAAEAVNQCLLHADALRDECTGCFFHDAHPASGRRTGWFWARGNGWVILAMADTLRLVPPSTTGYDRLLALYRSLATGLLRFQHPCGLWRIVPERDESHLETSGSIMIAAALAIGVTERWLDATTSAQVLQTWQELQTWINPEGALMGAQRPAGPGGWESHKQSMMAECPYATGLLLRLVAELERMQRQPLENAV